MAEIIKDIISILEYRKQTNRQVVNYEELNLVMMWGARYNEWIYY